MTHIKLHTEAIVLGSAPSGEADRFLYLLTRDFGFIAAHARGVRKISSKLRYSLQDFSHISTDLLPSKSGWRVASAIYIGNFFQAGAGVAGEHHAAITGRICGLLKRLLHGEEKNEVLFEDVRKGLYFLSSGELATEDARAVEVVLVMRILNHLGYWGDDSMLSPFLAGDISARAHIEHIKKQKNRAIGAINKALQETQL